MARMGKISRLRRPSWTKADIIELRKLWRHGLTDREISLTYSLKHRGHPSVREKRRSLGMSANKAVKKDKRWRTPEMPLLMKLLGENMRYKDIAKLLNRTERSVCTKIQRIRDEENDYGKNTGWTEDNLIAMYEADALAHDGQRYTSMTMKIPAHRKRIEQIALAWPEEWGMV